MVTMFNPLIESINNNYQVLATQISRIADALGIPQDLMRNQVENTIPLEQVRQNVRGCQIKNTLEQVHRQIEQLQFGEERLKEIDDVGQSGNIESDSQNAEEEAEVEENEVNQVEYIKVRFSL